MPPAPPGPGAAFAVGDFVLCNFPYHEAPGRPGPKPHYGLCLATADGPGGVAVVVAAYTTTQPWPAHLALPRGVHRIDRRWAASLGHRQEFVVDARMLGFLPVTGAYFPRLGFKDLGRRGRDPKLAQRLIEDLKILARTPGSSCGAGAYIPW